MSEIFALGDLVDFLRSKGLSKNDIDINGVYPCLLYGQLYTFYKETIQQPISYTNVTQGVSVSYINDILVPSSGETAEAIARASVNKFGDLLLSGALNILRPKDSDKLNSQYLSLILNWSVKSELIKRAQGATVSHLSGRELKNIQVKLPSLKEQQKIADFFTLLDERISKQEDKIALLEQQKNGYVQKIFNRELKFKDDNGEEYPEWESYKMDQVLDEIKYDAVENPNDIELLTVKLYGKGILKTGNFPKPTLNGRPYYRRSAGELLIGRQNFHNGGIGIVTSETNGLIASNAITGYTSKDNRKFSLNFISDYLLRPAFYSNLDALIGGTGAKEMNRKDFNSLQLRVPFLEEQIKIVNFIETLTKKIMLEKNKLNILNKQKSKYLSDIFN